jgi:hypothetical protein
MAKRETNKGSLSNSPWMRVQQESKQAPELRRRLICQIERHFDAKVVTFFTSFMKDGGRLVDHDAEMVESILSSEHKEGRLILVVNSGGGAALAAERMVNVCRAYSKGEFDVIVPHMAKSAATMICFGARRIHMARTGELGPVDPQVPYTTADGMQTFISAQEYLRSYENLMKQCASGKNPRIEPYLQQLQRYDDRFLEQLRSHQALSEDISVRLLGTGMMKGKSEEEIRRKIEVFLSQTKTRSHGRMIGFDEALECGLLVEELDLRSEIWSAIWELYVRSDWSVGPGGHAKVLETSVSAVHAQ